MTIIMGELLVLAEQMEEEGVLLLVMTQRNLLAMALVTEEVGEEFQEEANMKVVALDLEEMEALITLGMEDPVLEQDHVEGQADQEAPMMDQMPVARRWQEYQG